jgi:hypothetical protein
VLKCKPVGVLEVVQTSTGKKERNDRVNHPPALDFWLSPLAKDDSSFVRSEDVITGTSCPFRQPLDLSLLTLLNRLESDFGTAQRLYR